MTPARTDLGFAESVREKFIFLEHDFGYVRQLTETTIVRYCTSSSIVNIYHGRQSYEIGFEFCIVNEEPTTCFSLPTILRAIARSYKGSVFFQASERSALNYCVKSIAELVETYCSKLLRGDEEVIRTVRDMQEIMASEVAKQYTITPVKRKALDAWQRKDYKAVIELYESVKNDLDDIEHRRLEFSKKEIKR